MKYKIGQKVVYIGPDYRNNSQIVRLRISVPAPLAIYTIRGGLAMGPCDGLPCYLLEEVVNPEFCCVCCHVTLEMHIEEHLLRPLIARKNDGEAFVAGLRPLLDTRIKVVAR